MTSWLSISVAAMRLSGIAFMRFRPLTWHWARSRPVIAFKDDTQTHARSMPFCSSPAVPVCPAGVCAAGRFPGLAGYRQAGGPGTRYFPKPPWIRH